MLFRSTSSILPTDSTMNEAPILERDPDREVVIFAAQHIPADWSGFHGESSFIRILLRSPPRQFWATPASQLIARRFLAGGCLTESISDERPRCLSTAYYVE